MADTWHLFVSNAGDEAASSDGGIDSRSSSPEVSDAASCIASQHVCGRLWSLDLCLPHLPMLPLSLAEARRPPRPHRLPRFRGAQFLMHCCTSSGRKDLPARSDFCYPWRHPTTCMLRFIIHAMYSVDALLLFFSQHKSSLDPVLAKNLR